MLAQSMLCLIASASAFVAPASHIAAARSGAIVMGPNDKPNNTPAKFAPDGPFGGFKKPGSAGGIPGDQSKSLQIRKFEEGSDYLFFQGPAPKTAVQEDLPDFFSLDNFADLKIGPLQLLFTATAGGLTFGLIAFLFGLI